MTRILVALQEGATVPDNTAPAQWNFSNDGSVGTKIADLVDSTNAATGISFAVGSGSAFTELGSSGAFSSDHQGYAEEAWETAWYCSGNDDTLVFSGFAANQTGTVKFGAWTSVGRDTRIDDQGGNTATAVAKAEPPNTVATLNWQADASGVLTLSPIVVSSFSYVQFLDFEYTAAALAIDSSPASISPTEPFSFTVSGPATAPTTGNTTGNFTGLTGIAPDSVTGSDPYTITWTLPRTTAKLFDATGYVFDITIDAESVSSSAIPYAPPTGSDYVTAGTIDTGAQVYTDYTGGTFVSTDQLVWDNSPDLSFTDDLNYVVTGTLSATVYRIAAAGTVDVENTMSFTLGNDGIVTAVVSPMVSNIVSSMVN